MRKSRSEQLRYKALEQRVYDQIAAAGPLYKVNIQLLLRDYQIDEALHALMERGRIIRFSDERYALPARLSRRATTNRLSGTPEN